MYTQLLRGQEDNVFFKDAIANMLRMLQDEGLVSQNGILKYIGEFISYCG